MNMNLLFPGVNMRLKGEKRRKGKTVLYEMEWKHCAHCETSSQTTQNRRVLPHSRKTRFISSIQGSYVYEHMRVYNYVSCAHTLIGVCVCLSSVCTFTCVSVHNACATR